jgi:hypothetical protein
VRFATEPHAQGFFCPPAGKGGSPDHVVGPFYGPLKEVSPAGTSGLITNTVSPDLQKQATNAFIRGSKGIGSWQLFA